MHVVLCSYRCGLNAESSKSCEPFPTGAVNSRLSTYSASYCLEESKPVWISETSYCYRLNARLCLTNCGKRFSR